MERGEVRELGLSNVGPRRLRVLHRRLAQRGVKLASVQVQFSLLAPRTVTTGWNSRGVSGISASRCWRTALLRLGACWPVCPGWASQGDTVLRSSLYRRLLPGSEVLRQAMAAIASARGVTQMQVALNWCRSHGACPIPGFRRPSQVVDARQALNWVLTEDERRQLDQLSFESAVRMPDNPFQSA